MGLFSKKKENKVGLSEENAYDDNAVILPLEANEDDDFWDFSPVNIQSASKHGLTANEILGRNTEPEKTVQPVEKKEVSSVAPSQRLFERMVNNNAAAHKENEAIPQQEQKSLTEKEIPVKRDISLSDELNGLIEQISISNKIALHNATADSVVADDIKSEKEAVAAEPVVKEIKAEPPAKLSFDTDIFKRFFVDENGKSAAVNKPLYSLDSVETILAEAEKNADKNIDSLILDKKPAQQPETIKMQVAEQEFHYYADEDTANFKAFDDNAFDTVYSPIEPEKPAQTAKTSQKPKREKTKFKVSIDDGQEPSADGDYNCLDDASRIKDYLKKRSGKTGLRLFLTILVEIAALLFLFIIPQNIIAKPVINLIVTALLFVINFNMLSGFGGIFNKEKQLELPLAFATCAAVIHAVCVVALSANDAPYLCLLLGLIQTFALIGKRDKYKRIFKNFRAIANHDAKYAVDLISDQTATRTMAGDSIEGDILLAAGRKTVNVNDFVKHSYSPQPHSNIMSVCAYIALAAAVIIFGATLYLSSDAMLAVNTFSLILLLGCPLAVTLIDTLPLWLTAKKLSYYHAMLAGHSSAQALSQVNAVAVDCHDLFPKGCVQLSGIKPLSPNKLDETIMYAAVLCEAMGNPLAPVFRKIANTSEEPDSPLSDSIKYEYRMGLSGWVNDCQLLIGNRTLMQAHSVSIPPLEADRAILKNGYFPVYVARDGVACVLLAISYKPNSEITYELRRLCNNGITLLINSTDPNITADMICDYFGLYKECVKIMHSDGACVYKEITNYQESTSAHASYSSSICGLLGAVTAASKIKNLTVVMLIIYIIFAVAGIALTAVLSFLGNINTFTTVYALLFQMLGILCACLPPYISRP